MTDIELLDSIMSATKYRQAQIADIIGVSKQFINLVYKGRSKFSLKNINALKQHFPQFFENDNLPSELTQETLKQYRIEHKYSQRELAELLGIYQPVLSDIEAGKSPITEEIKNNFYRVFAKETRFQSLHYCPEVGIPYDFTLPKHPEVIKVDKRLLRTEKGLTVNYANTYIVSVIGDNYLPEFKNDDRVLLDTSHKSFKDGYTYFLYVNKQPYIRRVNVSPDRVKCIPFNKEEDAFYLEGKNYEIVGLIVPHIRL